jgi:hypothetical protein
MAPEQWKGEPSSPGTDVYAMGSILFECLTGRTPFKVSGGPLAYLPAHLHETPPRLREVDPSLPKDLDAVIARCLAKSPAARYASAGELARALQGSGGVKAWLGLAGEVLLIGVVLAALGFGLIRLAGGLLVEEMRPAAAALAELTAKHMEDVELDLLQDNDDVARPEFAHLCDIMDRVETIHPAVSYVFVLRQVAEQGGWVLLASHDYTQPHGPGHDHRLLHGGSLSTGQPFLTQHADWILEAMHHDLPLAQDDFAQDTFGYTLSGFAAIGPQRGAGAHVLGVDVGDSRLVFLRTAVIAALALTWLLLSWVWARTRRRKSGRFSARPASAGGGS